MVGTFGVVLYRDQLAVFFLHFAELHICNSLRYENNLLRNYFLKCYIVKIILISFNCFSEYIFPHIYTTSEPNSIPVTPASMCQYFQTPSHVKLLGQLNSNFI